MELVTLSVNLKLHGPILSRDSSPQLAGFDSPMSRTRHRPDWLPAVQNGHAQGDGERYCLPFSHIKGRLRWSVTQLFSEATAEDLFGKNSPSASTDDPWRGRVGVSDFYGPEVEEVGTALRDDSALVNIAIDPHRKANKKGSVHIIENAFPTGTIVDLCGQFYFLAKDETDRTAVCDTIEQGLRWTATYGALRTVGFGRVASIQLEINSANIAEPKPGTNTAYHDLALNFRDPFCIAKRRISDNTFESSEEIPGGAIKGAISSMLNAMFGRSLSAPIDESLSGPWSLLGKHFGKIRFLHAVASVPNGERPPAVPFSLVLDDSGNLLDAAMSEGPFLVNGKSPRFSADWKADEFDTVRKEYGQADLISELRVRTAIDGETWRAADERLFAYEIMVPGGYVWKTVLDLSQVDRNDRATVYGCLKSLFDIGLYGIGKTKARVSVTLSNRADCEMQSIPDASGVWIVTLRTPALLAAFQNVSIGMDTNSMAKAYAGAWGELSGQSLRVRRYFSRESLAGGGYIRNRFQSKNPYNPFLLTEAGSVFILEAIAGKESVAKDFLTGSMRDGLKLPADVTAAYGDDWKSNPYLPANGYGEIAVKPACHNNPKPEVAQSTLINPPLWWSALNPQVADIAIGEIA